MAKKYRFIVTVKADNRQEADETLSGLINGETVPPAGTITYWPQPPRLNPDAPPL